MFFDDWSWDASNPWCAACAGGALAAAVAYHADILGARYRLKVAAYYLALLVNSAAIIPVVATRPRHVENMLLGAASMRPISKLLGLEWTLGGALQHLTESARSFVIVANHQHSIDVLGLFELWPLAKRMTTVSKRQLLYAGSFGPMAWLCGTTFIDRSRGRGAREELDRVVAAAAEDKVRVLVFPEGTRNLRSAADPPTLLPFKTGAFSAAISAGVPVLPVVFSPYGAFLDPAAPSFESGRVRVTVLDPVDTAGMDPATDSARLAESVRSAMLEVLLTSKDENKVQKQ